jgi:drug/metabolite transporter (DMT)-like permease
MRMQKNDSTIESVLLSHLITAVVCFAVSLFMPFPKITMQSAIAILILGIFQLGISSVLFSVAIKKISAVSASLIGVIEPIFNPLWVFIVLRETPSVNTIIGGMIILFSVTALSIVTVSRKSS